jgi:hypothetical protein
MHSSELFWLVYGSGTIGRNHPPSQSSARRLDRDPPLFRLEEDFVRLGAIDQKTFGKNGARQVVGDRLAVL